MSKRLLLDRKHKDIYAFQYQGYFGEFEVWYKSIGEKPDISESPHFDKNEGRRINKLSIVTNDDFTDDLRCISGTEVEIGDYIIYDTHLGWDIIDEETLQEKYKILKPLGMKVERKKREIHAFQYKDNYEKFKKWVTLIGVNTPLDEFSIYNKEDNYLHIITYTDELDDYRQCHGTYVEKCYFIVYEEGLGWDVLHLGDFMDTYQILKD